MTVSIALFTYAVVVGLGLAGFIQHCPWTRRSARLALAAWGAGLASVLGALMTAGLALAAPELPLWPTELLHACLLVMLTPYNNHGHSWRDGVGAVLAVGLGLRFAQSTAWGAIAARRARRRHAADLRTLGVTQRHDGVLLAEATTPAVYCLPGRNARIVVTRGALKALEAAEMRAAIAHERAHLRGRHHLALLALNGCRKTLFFVPAARRAAGEVPLLLEMRADEGASRRVDRVTVAHALVNLASAPSRGPVLAAGGGTGSMARVERLLNPPAPLGAIRPILAGLAGLVLVGGLVFAAAAPSIAAASAHACPVELHLG